MESTWYNIVYALCRTVTLKINEDQFNSLSFCLFTGPKEFFYKGHHYFFSGHVPALANRKVDWLDGRNICREYCMDLVSMETQEENNLIFKLIQQSKSEL